MGFDLLGMNKYAEEKPHFRNNIWWWHPLWDYIEENCPGILTEEQIKDGHYNEGVFVSEDQAMKLATTLEQALTSGAVKRHEEERQARIRQLNDENREDFFDQSERIEIGPEESDFNISSLVIQRSGRLDTRLDPDTIDKIKSQQTLAVISKALSHPDERDFRFSESNVRAFAEFCRESGGFTIR
jgi:hypothetical protein